MLNAVTAINHLGESIVMELRSPEKTGFAISDISGIGPPKADISMTDLATIDGGFYNRARATTRNISFNIIFINNAANNELIEDVRHKSYKYFPIKKPVTLIFETDKRLLEIMGYVESNEPNIFSKQEEARISILCPYPYFYDATGSGYRETRFSYNIPLFEFEYENDSYSITDDKEAATIFGDIVDQHETNITYYGDEEVGMTITISLTGEVKNPGIYSTLTNEFMTLDTDKIETILGGSLQAGDDIIINTVKGSKSVRHLRNGVYTNVLNGLDRHSQWIYLHRGDNVLGFSADDGIDNMIVTVRNRTLYEGV